MAIAVNNGHVNRALDFFNTPGKYFILGGTTPWSTIGEGGNEIPDKLDVNSFRLRDIIGLKKVDNAYMVVPTDDTENIISYRNQNWKRIDPEVAETTTLQSIAVGETTIYVDSVKDFSMNSKVRVNNIYESTIVSIDGSRNIITLSSGATEAIPAGKKIIGGALVENAKYVYIECYLNYDLFPISTYRQIGLCTGVHPVPSGKDEYSDILVPPGVEYKGYPQYVDTGNLEVLDNRGPSTRNSDQRELLSMIIEF